MNCLSRGDCRAKPAGVVFNEHTDENGGTVFRYACELGFDQSVGATNR
jgi:hypothetical protein